MRPAQHIVHVASNLDGYGLTRQLELLSTEQLVAGHQVSVVALSGMPQAVSNLERLGIDCQRLHRRWRHDPIALMRLAKTLRGRDYDILHLWGQAALEYSRTVIRFVPRRPSLTTLPSQTLHNSKLYECISPGVAPPAFANLSRQDFLAEQLLSEDSILIVVAGPLVREQGIDEAIWNFELVRTLDERVRLLIFGDGPDRPRLERFSRLTSDSSAIRFLGYRSDFRELLAHAHLFWHTAVQHDGLPVSVLEAMAAGVPVVANDAPDSRTLIDDDHSGYLVTNGDRAIFARQTRRVLLDAENAERLGTNAARSVSDRFSVDTMAQAYAESYEQLLSA